MLAKDIHNLYPEIVYRFNTILFSIWKAHDLGKIGESDEKGAYLLPIFFSNSTRTFHWIGADSPMWDDEEIIRWQLTELIDHLCRWNHDTIYYTNRGLELALDTRLKVWNYFLADLPNTEFSSIGARLICQEIERIHTSGKDVWNSFPHDWETLQRSVLALYSGYHQSAQRNIEGVFYKYFEQGKIPEDNGYLTGTLAYEGDKTEGPFDLLQIDGMPEPGSLITAKNEFQQALDALAQDIFLENILLRNNNKLNANKRLPVRIPFGEGLAKRKLVMLLPVYDLWVYDPATKSHKGFGGIKTLFILFFQNNDLRTAWLKDKYALLCVRLNEVANHITASAQVLAASQPIEAPYDLLHHFLKVLRYVQDWESATVFKNGKAQYRYKRIDPGSSSFKWGWEWKECDPAQTPIAPAVHESIKKIDELESKYGMWWTPGEDMPDGSPSTNLWSADFITGIEAEEIARFGGLSIHFEFPAATRIPPTDTKDFKPCQALRQEYLRQQRDLLHALIPKVRARRAALRSAVSAIMGRNMSHNIGSHVLARYSGKINDDHVPKGEKTDHQGDFFSYLQRRMDFLAEMATSDGAFWAAPLSLKAQIERLNYRVQQDRFAEGAKPVLLTYITGKETGGSALKASVDYHGEDLMFSCPGGDVGVHALFVILENIIRNSARHGAEDPGEEMITITVCSEDNDSEFIKLDIIDPRSQLDEDGRILSKSGAGEHQNGSGADSNPPVHQKINDILRNEPFLDAEGRPNSKYWGIREMQICAHYLRGFPLSDLEGNGRGGHPVLEAGVKEIDGGYCLKYKVYLQRAKLMAAVVKNGSVEAIAENPQGEDSNEGAKQKADALRKQGILIINEAPLSAEASWDNIAEQVSGYSFLVVEEGVEIPTNKKASLPVRTFPLARAGNDGIEECITKARNAGDNALEWMESLHRHWAENCRDKRTAWKKKPLWGVVAVGANLDPPRSVSATAPAPPAGQTNGLFRVRKTRLATPNLDPLPPGARTWHATLEECAIAAAWVDHWNHDDITLDYAGLAQAYRPAPAHQNGRLWISAEGAFNDSPHDAYLKTCGGNGWELLAAAVPRVAVLDERVQSEASRLVRGGITLRTAWPLIGVWVPDSGKCNLDYPKLEDCRTFLTNPGNINLGNINEFIEYPKSQYPIDFLILHLTVLERLSRDAGKSLSDTLNLLVAGTQAKDADIIIVTGRGLPGVAGIVDNARDASGSKADADIKSGCRSMDQVRYLPISALLESLTTRPSKLGLMRTIWSAGRPAQNQAERVSP